MLKEMLSHSSKLDARKAARQNRLMLWQADKQQGSLASELICNRFMAEIKPTSKDIVSLTLALGEEIDLSKIMATLHDLGIKVALPKVEALGIPLNFYLYKKDDALELERFGTYSPFITAPKALPTIMVVPLLAFDRDGYRLGYGGGFYDRTIMDLNQAQHKFITIGIAFSGQELKQVPREAHDQPLDYIITEKEMIRINPSPSSLSNL